MLPPWRVRLPLHRSCAPFGSVRASQLVTISVPSNLAWVPPNATTAISALRTSAAQQDSPADAYEFQRDLLAHLLDVETARSGFSRAVKRMRKGGSPQADAPEPETGDPARIETWQLERDMFERVARQLRSVGDALAWRAFNYQRQFILALCRNQPAGPMAGKDGLLAELDAVDRLWRDERRFGLLHDLTNCLRIADLTEFRGRRVLFREVKTNARRRDPAQLARIQQTAQALWEDQPLPGDGCTARLVSVDAPLRTQLGLLGVALTRADQEDVFAVKAPGRRAVLATDLYGLERQDWSTAQFQQISQRRLATALRRARADGDRGRNVSISSSDHVARDPLRVPPPLTEALGGITWYLDAMLDHDAQGTEVVGGVHKWVLEGNWKLAAEQFASDWYHVNISHASALMVMSPTGKGPKTEIVQTPGRQYSDELGHGHGFPTHPKSRFDDRVVHESFNYTAARERLGDARVEGPMTTGHGTVFPNFSYLPVNGSIRVWHPKGPDRMEVWAWTLVDRSMSKEAKNAQRLYNLRTFGPTGIFEQDDGENWSECQATAHGFVSGSMTLNYQMGLGLEAEDGVHPGTTGRLYADGAARGLYARWRELMNTPAWHEKES